MRLAAGLGREVLRIGQILHLHDLAGVVTQSLVEEAPELGARDAAVVRAGEQAAARGERAERSAGELPVVAGGAEAALLGGGEARRIEDDEIEGLVARGPALQPGEHVGL